MSLGYKFIGLALNGLLRIEMQIFSLHWMMQNIRLLMSVKPEGLLGDIKTLMFCIIQCKLKI